MSLAFSPANSNVPQATNHSVVPTVIKASEWFYIPTKVQHYFFKLNIAIIIPLAWFIQALLHSCGILSKINNYVCNSTRRLHFCFSVLEPLPDYDTMELKEVLSKFWKIRGEGMAQWLRSLPLLTQVWGQLKAPTWWLTGMYNAIWYHFQVCKQTCRQSTHINK